MAVGPIPNIAAMPVKVASAAPADLPSTRSVVFYPQQEESSYTLSGQDQQEPEGQETVEQELAQSLNLSPEVVESKLQVKADPLGDPSTGPTISLFA